MTERPRGEEDERAESIGMLVPLVALAALAPPIMGLFAGSGVELFGAPLVMLYLFVHWLGMIVIAALIARRLRPIAEAPPGETEDDAGS